MRQSVRNGLVVRFPYGASAMTAPTQCTADSPPLDIGPDQLPEGTLGQPYEVQFGTDGVPPLMWTLRQGPGYLDATGLYQWDEPDAEIATLEVRVTDSRGLKGHRTFSLIFGDP